MQGSFVIDILLNGFTLSAALVAFVSAIFILVAKRKALSRNGKIGLLILLGVTAAYFLFVICALVALSDPPFAYP